MEYNQLNSSADLESLIGNLRKEDTRNTTMMNNMQKLMWGVAILYVLLSVMKFIQNSFWYEKAGAVLILLAFIVFALLFRNYYKAYKSIDYGLPTIEMLSKAVNRYQLFQWRGLSMLVPLVLEDIGLIMMMYDIFDSPDPLFRILMFQSGFLFLLAVGSLSGYLIWRKRQKPLRDHALELLKEIRS